VKEGKTAAVLVLVGRHIPSAERCLGSWSSPHAQPPPMCGFVAPVSALLYKSTFFHTNIFSAVARATNPFMEGVVYMQPNTWFLHKLRLSPSELRTR